MSMCEMLYTARLEERLNRFIIPVTESGCHIWIGSMNKDGYGQLYDGRYGRPRVAHKIIYELANGPVRHGLQLDHLCRIRCCVNVHHLKAVTSLENSFAEGSLSPNNLRRLQTHCIHGHEFNAANTYMRKDGHGKRECRECHNQRRQKKYVDI